MQWVHVWITKNDGIVMQCVHVWNTSNSGIEMQCVPVQIPALNILAIVTLPLCGTFIRSLLVQSRFANLRSECSERQNNNIGLLWYSRVLFHCFCSHAQVLWPTLVHEFRIFLRRTGWNFLSSQCDNTEKARSLSAVEENSLFFKILSIFVLFRVFNFVCW